MSSSSHIGALTLAAALIAALAGQGWAQELKISNSPSPVGAGARAAGMADAFVAVADDATAASWNPAGLVQLERPEISVVGGYSLILERFSADHHDEFNSSHSTGYPDLNFASLVYPLPVTLLGRNVCLSLNYQKKYDFNRSFSFDLNRYDVTAGGRVISDFGRVDFVQKGGLSAITPAIAIEITPRLAIGASLNLWRSTFLSDNRWEQTIKHRSTTLLGSAMYLSGMRTRERYADFTGENMTLGLLWSPLERLSVGVRYDTAFTGRTNYRNSVLLGQVDLTSIIASALPGIHQATEKERREVRFPDSLAFGAAWRASDKFTLSMDVTRTNWNDFYVKTGEGKRQSLVDYSNLDNPWTRTRFKPTHAVRMGMEYVFLPDEPEETLNRLWSIRGGVFLEQEPATGKRSGFRWPGDNGSGKPDNFYGGALGVGLLLNHRINLDAAWQIRYGPGVNRDLVRGVRGFKEDTVQQRFLISTVVYF